MNGTTYHRHNDRRAIPVNGDRANGNEDNNTWQESGMSDPVDTDALRAVAVKLLGDDYRTVLFAADEVDRLRDRLRHVEKWTVPEAIRTWTKERDEKDRLRTVIEDAPHDPSCWLVDPQSTWTKNERDCTCWKADAL